MVQNKIPGFDRIVVEKPRLPKKVSPFEKVKPLTHLHQRQRREMFETLTVRRTSA